VRVPQLGVKARLAHSACFAAITLREAMSTAWTSKIRAGHCAAIWDGDCFRPAPDTLLTDNLITLDAKSGHVPRTERDELGGDAGDCHTRLEFHLILLWSDRKPLRAC
jgi:hypothetical protein